ncbi:hypothetical protein ABTY63_19375, partial [Streptomyces solisilvae]|uniref:hypothetical protein n=1 Tax=Streptomyces malaysiensis TaxID=92644 RepID=UPI0033288648
QGYIAPADCVEVRVNLTDSERLTYATAETDENPATRWQGHRAVGWVKGCRGGGAWWGLGVGGLGGVDVCGAVSRLRRI